MTVKFIAFDGTEFNNEKECTDYERESDVKICTEIGNARHALKRLDDFCDFWSSNLCYDCINCPLIKLCDGIHTEKFEDYFNKENPFGNIDYAGDVIEED